jgi:chemotaxis protein CheX
MSAPVVYSLPSRLDLTTAAALRADLQDRAGADLMLDASSLTHLGTPGLQVLLAARRTWSEEGLTLAIAEAPASVLDQLRQFGLSLSDLVTADAPALSGDPDLTDGAPGVTDASCTPGLEATDPPATEPSATEPPPTEPADAPGLEAPAAPELDVGGSDTAEAIASGARGMAGSEVKPHLADAGIGDAASINAGAVQSTLPDPDGTGSAAAEPEAAVPGGTPAATPAQTAPDDATQDEE